MLIRSGWRLGEHFTDSRPVRQVAASDRISFAISSAMALIDAAIFVFERSSYWAPQLQRCFVNENVHVRQCSSLADVRQVALPSRPPFRPYPRVVLMDFASSPSGCLQFIVASQPARIGVPTIVYAVGAAELEWVIREAGATEVLVDYLAAHEMARLCRRLLDRSRPMA